MKKIISLLAATGFVTQVFSAALTVTNGDFQTGGTTGCGSIIANATGWHSLTTIYDCNHCASPADTKDGTYAYYYKNTDACGGSAFSLDRYAQAKYTGFGNCNQSAANALIFQQMSNNASSNTCYRASAYVKSIAGFGVSGALGIAFVNTSVGSTATQILNAVRAQSGSFLVPTFTSVTGPGGGWYKMTVDWTPPTTGTYYIIIGHLVFCDDGNVQTNRWIMDDVSITCLADAGIDKNNSDRNCCSVPQFSSVQIGTTHGCSDLSYSWSNGTSLSCTTCQQPNASPKITTDYTLTTSGAYCVTATDVVRVTPLPISQNCCAPPSRIAGPGSISGILVYPNPSNGVFKITIDDGVGNAEQIKICDMQGKIVFEKVNSERSLEVDLSKYSNGTYIISVYEAGNQTTKNLIKE